MRSHTTGKTFRFAVLAPSSIFFFNDTATTEIYTLSLHDALPISKCSTLSTQIAQELRAGFDGCDQEMVAGACARDVKRSEEHTSELQSLAYLVCRLLLEKKKSQHHTRPLRPHASAGDR